MCFSNLPIEFDEAGDPYLAEEADGIEHVTDCGCGGEAGIDEEDPEAVFDAVVSSVPESVREEIEGRDALEDRDADALEGRDGDAPDEPEPGEATANERADDPAGGD